MPPKANDDVSEIVAPAVLTMRSGQTFRAAKVVVYGDTILATGYWSHGDGRVKTLSWPRSTVRAVAAVDDGWAA